MDQTTYLAKVDRNGQNLGVDPFPLVAILDFAGGAALQAVRHCRRCGIAGGAALQAVRRCRRCGVAGGERVPPSPLGWY